LINAGVAGAVLAWFMFRTDARLTKIESALERVARTQLLQTISSTRNPAVRREAEKLLEELDDRQGVTSLRRRG
jgi:plasmid maintenance system killer protein